MKIEITQQINKAYYEEYYGEWLKFRTKYRKIQNTWGIASIASAVIFYFFDTSGFMAILLFIFGLIMIFDFYFSKHKWMKARLKSKMLNSEVQVIFGEEGFQTEGPFTKSSSSWSLFNDAIESDKGLILIPETGVALYFQKKVFENQLDIDWIVRRIKVN